jgi:hypothetical protein
MLHPAIPDSPGEKGLPLRKGKRRSEIKRESFQPIIGTPPEDLPSIWSTSPSSKKISGSFPGRSKPFFRKFNLDGDFWGPSA